MVNVQLIEIITCLKREDLPELRLFLEAEFHNRTHFRKHVISLFDLLCRFYPDFDDSMPEYEKIYAEVFPDGTFVEGKLDKTASELKNLVREFLIWKNYQVEDEGFSKDLLWAKILRKFSLGHRLVPYLSRIEKKYLLVKTESPELYFRRFLLEYDRYFWLSAHNTAKKDVNLFTLLESLNSFFHVYRLELSNALLFQQKVAFLDIPAHIQAIQNQPLPTPEDSGKTILTISIKINALLQKETPTIPEFNELMSLLEANEGIIGHQYLSEFYVYLRNFLSIVIDSKQFYLIPVLHQLYRDNLEKGYLFVNEKLMGTTYMNITRVAIFAKNTAWASEFVEQYKDMVMTEPGNDDHYRIAKALCLFDNSSFDLALDLLPHVSENAIFYLLSRRLELMCHYELKSENILYRIEAFKMMIRRASEKTLPAEGRDIHNAFANFLSQMVLTAPGDKKRAEKIQQRVISQKKLAESIWLIDKAKELTGKGYSK